MRRRLLWIVLAGALLLFLPSRIFLPGYTRVDLTEGDKGGRIFTDVLKDGEPALLTWRNSQFGLQVTERFFARSGLLVQDRVTFAALDGSPPPRVSVHDVDDLYHTGGAFDARGLSRPFSRIVYRIGEIGNPKMVVKNRTVAFKREAGFGGRIILTAARPNLFELLVYRLTETGFGGFSCCGPAPMAGLPNASSRSK